MTLDNYEYYIVLPREATNEVLNPSVETGITGYTAVGAGVSIARVATYQRRGAYSLEVTPATGVESGVYYGTVNEVAGVARTFSPDVYNLVAGQPMRIQIRDTAGGVLSEQTFTSNGYWQRPSLTRVGTASTTRRLYVVRDAVASTAKFYVDGLLYSTVNGTYLDGDMRGYVKSRRDYRWNGTPHASTSWRSGQTRSGGTLMRIKDYARILTVLGLGMAPISNTAQPLAADYSSYQTTTVNDREFVLNLAIIGDTLGAIQTNRQALIDAVRPDRVTPKQPLLLRYQGVDGAGADASEPVDIVAHYVDGLGDGPTSHKRVEFAPMRFVAYLPFLSRAGDSAASLGYQTSIANANYAVKRVGGVWAAVSSTLNGAIYAMAKAPDGSIYIGGAFTDVGSANGDRILKLAPDGTISSLGTGASGTVKALAVAPNGDLYAGGAFASMGGLASTIALARWDGAAWNSVGGGFGASDQVFALAFDFDGSLYVGGSFTDKGDANGDYIVRWTGSAWLPFGAGANSMVWGLAVSPSGNIAATGTFTSIGGVTANRIALWDGTSWSAMGSGLGSNSGVDCIFDNAGRLYVTGDFSTAGGITVNNVARWNGTGWEALGSGINGIGHSLSVATNGPVYVSGVFTSAGGLALADRLAAWTGSYWIPVDIDLPGTPNVWSVLADGDNLYLGYDTSGAAIASGATTTVTNAGTTATYPVLTLTGPGRLTTLRNEMTGATIYFNLTLLAGETVTLDLRPGKFRFESSFRGNLYNTILPGSNLDFPLQPGANDIFLYIDTGTTAATAALMTWQDGYWSVDGAKR